MNRSELQAELLAIGTKPVELYAKYLRGLNALDAGDPEFVRKLQVLKVDQKEADLLSKRQRDIIRALRHK